jgi:hypothetical protein
VRGAEAFAAEAVEEVAGNRLARREADRVHEAVELGPGLAELGEQALDLRVVADVALEDQLEPNSAANSVMRSLKRSPT